MIYTVGATANVSAAVDVLELLVPSDAVVKLLSLEVTQEDLVAVAFWLLTLRRVTGAPTSGSGGSAPTPTPVQQGDTAAGSTTEVFNTTQLTGGTNVVMESFRMNVLSGLFYRPIPEEMIYFSPSTRAVLELETAPSAATDISLTARFEEIGG